MSQKFTKEYLLEQVRNLAAANGATVNTAQVTLEDLAKQAVSAAKVLKDFLEADD